MFRIQPAMGAEAYKTYQLSAPPSSHRRPASCAEVECGAMQHGWQMGFDVTDPEKAAAVKWIRMHSGRQFRTEQVGSKVILTFLPGQACFEPHTIPLEREPFYLVRGGDWRGNPRQTEVRSLSEENWVDDFATHQDRLSTVYNQG
jgi:hypothetical protein